MQGERLTGGFAVEVLRKVYHERKDQMPEGWRLNWRSGSLTISTGESDALQVFREQRGFEGSSDMINEVEYIHNTRVKRDDQIDIIYNF
jgi:hypothetical protein